MAVCVLLAFTINLEKWGPHQKAVVEVQYSAKKKANPPTNIRSILVIYHGATTSPEYICVMQVRYRMLGTGLDVGTSIECVGVAAVQ
jgi:predicted GH43/DUF377 family glycosyl hydrolase